MATSSIAVCSNEEFQAKLLQLRDLSLRPSEVRRLTSELTTLIARDAITKPSADERVAVVVILRSGMQMTDSFLAELPEDTDAVIYHLGLFRDKISLQPVEYYNKLPAKDPKIRHAYILDPVLATGGTVSAAINILKDWGVEKITPVSLLAAQVGVTAAAQVWPANCNFVVGAIDPELDSQGHIKPGIGDIGDRLFGTI